MLIKQANINSKLLQNSRKSFFYFLVLFVVCSQNMQAQCAMCRASLESTGDVSQAQAVNDGIVYLMIVPYVLVALIGFAVYKMFRKKA